MNQEFSQPIYIAGWNTAAEWRVLRARLVENDSDAWKEAFRDFFEARLTRRYLRPIEVLRQNGTYSGEGFSILAIQCTLIEFLESTARGVNYRYLTRGERLGPYEYSSSQEVFVAFLKGRQPFSKTFDETSARDFYVGVRCALLHEARTSQGWRVWAKSPNELIANVKDRIVFRDDFHEAIVKYTAEYGERLQNDRELQAAFIRKFDCLAV